MTTDDVKWRRSRDQMIAGVCAGIAERLGWKTNRATGRFGKAEPPWAIGTRVQ